MFEGGCIAEVPADWPEQYKKLRRRKRLSKRRKKIIQKRYYNKISNIKTNKFIQKGLYYLGDSIDRGFNLAPDSEGNNP